MSKTVRFALVATALLVLASGLALSSANGARSDSAGPPHVDLALRVVSSTHVGGSPSSIAIAADDVWVSLGMDGIVRIDRETNTTVARIKPGGAVIGLAAGFGAVWAIDVFRDLLLRIDPSSNTVSQTIRVGGLPNGIAVGHGSVWVQNQLDATLMRVDPATGRVAATIELALGDLWPGAIVTDRDAVWIVTANGNGVGRIDPVTSTLGMEIPVLDARSLAFARGSVWVGRARTASLVRISGKRIAYVDIPGYRSDAYGPKLAGGSALWFAAAGAVAEVGPRLLANRQGYRLPKLHHISAVAVSGDVWVADQTAGRIVRLGQRSP